MKSRAIAWFRNDLRVHDNVLLHEVSTASKNGFEVICLYCFDPRHFQTTPFGSIKCDRHRAQFLLESVANLRQNLKLIDSNLFVSFGNPEEIIPRLVSNANKSKIFVQNISAYEEQQVVKNVRRALGKIPGSSLHTIASDSTLYHIVRKLYQGI